jgi:hypothetical protein
VSWRKKERSEEKGREKRIRAGKQKKRRNAEKEERSVRRNT